MDLVEDDPLKRLKILHRDLVSLSESRLPNIERLQTELEARINDFRGLLDKSPKNDKSRHALLTGKVNVNNEEFQVNEEFKQDSVQLADFLNLDELDAAKLYTEGLAGSLALDRKPLNTSVILFHERRQFLLECLRLCLYNADEAGIDHEDLQLILQSLKQIVLENRDGNPSGPLAYWKKVVEAMKNIESWIQQLNERIQSVSMTGQAESDAFVELIRFQLSSLNQQHQSLGATLYHIVKAGYLKVDGFKDLLRQVIPFERYDVILSHYIPALSAGIWYLNSSEGQCSAQEARSLHNLIVATRDNDAWAMRSFQATITAFWIAEYCARFGEQPDSTSASESSVDASFKTIPQKFTAALRDGALQFVLTLSQDIQNPLWIDPLRNNLLDLLLQEAPLPRNDQFVVDAYFKEIFFKQMQSFSEACITNLPDTLRDLKSEEDELRRQLHGQMQLQNKDYEYHLERFLLIIAFAYEGSEDAADSFWSEPDGNLYGFLQWASQRQSTPHVAAFCEMLRALANGESGAGHAHGFLLEDASSTTGRPRRNSPLSWAHIIREIEFYSTAIRDRPSLQQGKGQTDQYAEPESAAMLELYLRLLSHLCQQSTQVRLYFLTHQSFHIHEHLLLLCGNAIETRLRAGCFNALASLLHDKTREVGDGIWGALDLWVSGNSPPSSLIPRPPPGQPSPISAEQFVFDLVSTGFDEPLAFVGLLEALVAPFQDESGLHDALPFQESLGAAFRMAGIEPYTDFVLGKMFAFKSTEIQDASQQNLLRCRCLQFASTCLSTFNEDLVVFANQSTISIDSAVRTSSLAAYARMHPFGRVMEWLFNDRVVSALFHTAKQDIDQVNEATSDSPLIVGLSLSIQVIDLAMTKQSTYLDIVRPIIKLQSSSRRSIVSNSALASFEDAILNNLDIVSSLGLYCGSGHQDLIILSLRLLQKLASSRKLVLPHASTSSRGAEKSRLVTALERSNNVEGISRSLVLQMQLDESELDLGPLSSPYITKMELLRFLNTCLATSPNRPTIAHALLGFTCHASALEIADSGLWVNGISLFHAILQYTTVLPVGTVEDLSPWLLTIKKEASAVIMSLLKSSLSAEIVLAELRSNDFLILSWLSQPAVSLDTLWDGRSIGSLEFFLTDSSRGFADMQSQRAFLFEYAAMEIRSASSMGLTTLRDRLKTTTLGSASLLGDQQIQCQTIFGMLDFIDAGVGDVVHLPQTRLFSSKDLDLCRLEESSSPKYAAEVVEQLLALRYQEIRANGQLSTATDEQQMQADADNVLTCLRINNQRADMMSAHTAAVKSWAQLVAVILDCCEFEDAEKDSFIVRSLEAILPRLEQSYAEDVDGSIILAQLGRSLLRGRISDGSSSSTTTEAAEVCFFQLFRISLAGIQSASVPTNLRETWVHICHDYLRHLLKRSSGTIHRQSALQSIKARGSGLFEVLCDEAYSGEGSCRTSALLLLGAITTLSTLLGSKYVLECFSKTNFIHVIVENIRNLSSELQSGPSPDQILSYHVTSFSLLLRICQTRLGASQVINSGLMSSIRASGLFSADPDIGLEQDNPAALLKYFGLLLSVIRILNAAVLSRGPQNDQTVAQARQFLEEYRPTIAAIFKRSAKIGLGGASVEKANQGVLDELSNALTVLMVSSGFLDTEEEKDTMRQAPPLFA